MKKTIFYFLLILITSSISISQEIPVDSLYLGQTPPGDSSVVFAPGKISKANRNESCMTVSPDGKLIFFSIEFYPNPGTPYILQYEYKNDRWEGPTTAMFSTGRMTNEPIFAFNGERVYLDATKAQNQVGDVDISYVTRNGTGWTDPVSLGTPPNSLRDQYHPCVVADTSIYFSASNGSIVRCQYRNGSYLSRVALPYPINNANTTQTWGDPYVAPDESYIIFKSTRKGGFGGNDIYIAYKKPDGTWTNPKNLGSRINTPKDESSGDITPDGLYMTFSSDKDLKWVSAGFIENLKHTNFAPYLKNKIPNHVDTVGHELNYSFPDSTFVDDDGNNTLTYSAKLISGGQLPQWLSFDPNTRTFSGIPGSTERLGISVTARDAANDSAACIFYITIAASVTANEKEEQVITGYKLFQNYPNPFNPATKIEFMLPGNEFVSLIVYDVLGRKVSELINDRLSAGNHSVEFDAKNISSGIYFYEFTSSSFCEKKKMMVLK